MRNMTNYIVLCHWNGMAVVDFVSSNKDRQLFTYNRGPQAFEDMAFSFDILHSIIIGMYMVPVR